MMSFHFLLQTAGASRWLIWIFRLESQVGKQVLKRVATSCSEALLALGAWMWKISSCGAGLGSFTPSIRMVRRIWNQLIQTYSIAALHLQCCGTSDIHEISVVSPVYPGTRHNVWQTSCFTSIIKMPAAAGLVLAIGCPSRRRNGTSRDGLSRAPRRWGELSGASVLTVQTI
jgi:hypothetical protein